MLTFLKRQTRLGLLNIIFHLLISIWVDRQMAIYNSNVLAIVKSAAMNVGVHIVFELQFSPVICPRVRLLSQMVTLFLVS